MTDFRPTADLETLRQRDNLVRKIRQFFEEKNFLHVETPLLSQDTVVDRHLHPIAIRRQDVTGESSTDQSGQGSGAQNLWLQTSPEFAMKRLLVENHTSDEPVAIYQICKAFRQGESGAGQIGSRHNPEFTMLEWYRTGDDLQAGMDLLDEFAQFILDCEAAEKLTYWEVFQLHAGVDPFDDPLDRLETVCQQQQIDTQSYRGETDRDEWLNLMMAEIIEPKLGTDRPSIVYDWPATQAALAKVRKSATGEDVAERFELYIGGVELANGYHELTCPDELLRRNDLVNEQRKTDGSRVLPRDSQLIEAMRVGLPSCSGVALGVDRLAMVALNRNRIDEVIAFPIDRA